MDSLLERKIIKEICVKLEMRIDVINEVYRYTDQFHNSNSHSFSEIVLLGSCIYLASKVNENLKRIRGHNFLIF